MRDLQITVSKIDDDTFIATAKFGKHVTNYFGTDYIQALKGIIEAVVDDFFSVALDDFTFAIEKTQSTRGDRT